MMRQETIQAISTLLPQQPQEKLEAILDWLVQEDDSFEKKLRIDVEIGKLDKIIASVITEDESGETIDLETSCYQEVLETL